MWIEITAVVLCIAAGCSLFLLGERVGSRLTSLPLKLTCGVLWLVGIVILCLFSEIVSLPGFFLAFAVLLFLYGMFWGISAH